MDQESLVQIQGIIGAATESLRADITDARRHNEALTEGLGQELRAEIGDAKRHTETLTQGLGEELRAEIADAKRHTEALTQGLGQELRAEIADAKRHTGVLTEGLRHDIQLVAEGFQMHLDRRHAEERSHLDQQFRETRALVQISMVKYKIE